MLRGKDEEHFALALEGAVDKCEPLVDDSGAMPTAYVYELRSSEEILATGRLLADEDFACGDELALGGTLARVEELAWANGEPRLVLSPTPLLS
jgi:hypothetical protein